MVFVLSYIYFLSCLLSLRSQLVLTSSLASSTALEIRVEITALQEKEKAGNDVQR